MKEFYDWWDNDSDGGSSAERQLAADAWNKALRLASDFVGDIEGVDFGVYERFAVDD
jgi:hypothetical protein